MALADAFNVGRFAIHLSENDVVEHLENLTAEERWDRIAKAPIGAVLSQYGLYVRKSEDHIMVKDLEPLRNCGDPLADAAVRLVSGVKRGQIQLPNTSGQAASDTAKACSPECNSSKDTVRDLTSVEILQLLAPLYPEAKEFLDTASAIPGWLDVSKIVRGQRMYCENAASFSVNLLNLSLIGGFGAPKINKVLESTGYLTKNRDLTQRRLFETTQMILDCQDYNANVETFATSNPMRVGGVGWQSVLNVRLLHASVRCWLMDSGHWDIKEYGIPINQEDTIATQLAFCIVPFMGMERIGAAAHISDEEMNGFVHLWRYIGYLMGIKDEYNNRMTDLYGAQRLMESIVSHVLVPSPQTNRIALHVIDAVSFRAPAYRTPFQMTATTRQLCGDVYADAVGIPPVESELLYKIWEERVNEVKITPKKLSSHSHSLLSTQGVLVLLYHWIVYVITLLASIQHRFRWRRKTDLKHLAEDAEAVAAATLSRLRVIPQLTKLPIIGRWLVAFIVIGINAFIADSLGGRTKFHIKLMPKYIHKPDHPPPLSSPPVYLDR